MMQLNRSLFFLISMVTMLFFSSCSKENRGDFFKRTGDITKEVRSLVRFDSIYVEDNMNVYVTEDSTKYEATVEAGKNLVSLIKTEVINGELHIHNDNKYNFMRSYKIPVNVYVHVPRTLVRITTDGTGKVVSTNTLTGPVLKFETKATGVMDIRVNTPRVFTWQHGDGDITLSGHAGELDIYNVGYGFTIADQCSTDFTWMHAFSTGRITCNASQRLEANIYGSGNVYYTGNPAQIVKTVYASGNLYPL